MPSVLPPCFSPVWRLRHSSLPHHARQRATLDAVASQLPPQAKALSGPSAAAAYLAALVAALDRLVATIPPVHLPQSRAVPDHRLSKKAASRARLTDARNEADISNASVTALLVPHAQTHEIATDAKPSAVGDEVPVEVGRGTALVSLVAMAVQGSSHAVINAKAEHVLQSVLSAYNHFSGFASIAHHTNIVIAGILAVLAPSVWPNPVVQKAFLYLIRHTADLDEALARNSRKALFALLNCPRGNVVKAKASNSAASYFVAEIGHMFELCQGDGTTPESPTHIEAFQNLLESVEGYSPSLESADAAVVAGELVLVAVKGVGVVSTAAFSALSTMFSGRIQKDTVDNSSSPLVGQSDLKKLLRAVLQYELPEDSPESSVMVYAACVASGTVAFSSYFDHFSPPAEFIFLPVEKLFKMLDPSGGRSSSTRNICRAMLSFLEERWFMLQPEILKTLEKFATNKYRPIWSDVVSLLRKYVEHGMAASKYQMQESVRALVKSMISIRERALSDNDLKFAEMAVSVLKAICRGGGASLTFNVCEIKFDKDSHITNRWLPPLLRDNIAGAPLSLFTENLMPVIETLHNAASEMTSKKRVIEAKNLGICMSQLWALLPGFCNKPADLGHEGTMTSAFKVIHKCITEKDDTSLYPIGVRALRHLSQSILGLSSEDPTANERCVAFSSRFKKLFPALIEVLGTVAEDKRGMLLDAVTVGCSATKDGAVVSILLRKSVKRLLETQLEEPDTKKPKSDAVQSEGNTRPDSMEVDGPSRKHKQHCCADLATAIAESRMVPDGAAELGFLEKALAPFFQDRKDSSLQKKAYRVSAMLISTSTRGKSVEQLSTVIKGVADAHGSLAAGAKAARQMWITAVINAHLGLKTEEDKEAYMSEMSSLFLSEIILGTRDTSEKSRSAAFETLVNMARAWHTLGTGNDTTGLRKLITNVSAGLVGKTASMVAGTLSSLSRLLTTFRHEIASDKGLRDLVDSLFATTVPHDDTMGDDDALYCRPGPVAIVMGHESAEVQRAAVGIVKTATRALAEPIDRLRVIVEGILPGLLQIAAGSQKRETRLKVRLVLERLMRRLGEDVLRAMFPSEHLPLLSAVRKEYAREIRKKIERKKRRREGAATRAAREQNESDESDSESDVERELVEGGEGDEANGADGKADAEFVDLLEARAGLVGVARGKSVKRTTKAGKRKDEDEVRYTEDGKPIFVDSDAESGEAEVGSVDDDDSDLDAGSTRPAKGSAPVVGKKRGRETDETERHAKKGKGSFGEEYRGRRGGGDVKRAGRPDPFAYIPLGTALFGADGARKGGGARRAGKSALSGVVGNGKKRKGGRGGVPGRR